MQPNNADRYIQARKKQNPTRRAIKQADLDTLKLAEQEGIIDLKYLELKI
jgi:hypothetical protein